MKKHYWLYVLRLEEDKYYVGVTSKTPEERFREHLNGIRAAKWTLKYKPVSIYDQKELGLMTYDYAQKYENIVVRRYMKERGYNITRGGDLTDPSDYVKFGQTIYDRQIFQAALFGLVCLTAAAIFALLYLYK
jgi:predicted GIY-YIG superfamily endonuclease